MPQLNHTETRIVALTRSLVLHKVSHLPGHDFGYGFLWGYITIRRALKNGSVKTFELKTCFGGICVADMREAVRLATSVADVSKCWVNMD